LISQYAVWDLKFQSSCLSAAGRGSNSQKKDGGSETFSELAIGSTEGRTKGGGSNVPELIQWSRITISHPDFSEFPGMGRVADHSIQFYNCTKTNSSQVLDDSFRN
jgi:hypothetical protein